FLVEPEDSLETYRREDPSLRGYAVARRMNLLAAEGKADEAARLGAERFAEEPSLPLAARLLEDAERARSLGAACDFLAQVKRFGPVELALGLDAARAALDKAGRPDAALAAARRLFDDSKSFADAPIRKRIAEFGAEVAQAEGDERLFADCRAYLDELEARAAEQVADGQT